MAFTNSATFSPCVPIAAEYFAVTSNVVVGGVVGANDVASVEGTTVDNVGMTILEVVAKSLCFD